MSCGDRDVSPWSHCHHSQGHTARNADAPLTFHSHNVSCNGMMLATLRVGLFSPVKASLLLKSLPAAGHSCHTLPSTWGWGFSPRGPSLYNPDIMVPRPLSVLSSPFPFFCSLSPTPPPVYAPFPPPPPLLHPINLHLYNIASSRH